MIRKNKHKIFTILALTLFVVMMGMFCAFNLKKDVEVIINPNIEGAQAETIVLSSQNMNQTVGELLASNQIDTTDYQVDQDMDQSIRSVDTIELKKIVDGKVEVDGANVIYHSSAATVGDLLAENNIEVGSDDVVTPSVDTPLTVDVNDIRVDRVEYKQETTQVEIPFDTTVTEDSSLPAATIQVTQQGVNGVKEVTENVKYVNGQRIGADVISEKVITEPVTQVQTQNSIGIPTGGHKTYSVSDSDFNLICAIVQHEGGASYDSALAVMSTVLNRADAGNWGGGSDPAGILTAPGQFESYFGGYYTQFLGCAADCVQQAVRDCLNGTRNHNFLSFRGYETTGSVQIGGGNYYFNEM